MGVLVAETRHCRRVETDEPMGLDWSRCRRRGCRLPHSVHRARRLSVESAGGGGQWIRQQHARNDDMAANSPELKALGASQGPRGVVTVPKRTPELPDRSRIHLPQSLALPRRERGPVGGCSGWARYAPGGSVTLGHGREWASRLTNLVGPIGGLAPQTGERTRTWSWHARC